MTARTPEQDATPTEVAARLSAYRAAHASLHADIRRAAELGFNKSEIARLAGLTREGVAKILNRQESSRG